MQLTFIQNEDVIQALAADAAEKSFTNGIGFGGTNRRSQHFDAAGGTRKFRAVFAVIVADQKPRMSVEGGGFAKLLSHPSIAGRTRDRKMNYSARAQLDDEKDEHRAKPEVIGLEEITSPNLMGVIGKKSRPGLAALPRRLGASHLPCVFGDSPLAEMIAQLAQFILNPFATPEPIVAGRGVNEGDYLGGNTG